VKSYLNFPCTPDLNLDVVIFSTLMIMHCFLHFVRQVFFLQEAITVVGFGDLASRTTRRGDTGVIFPGARAPVSK